jgi:hypothetical protein
MTISVRQISKEGASGLLQAVPSLKIKRTAMDKGR